MRLVRKLLKCIGEIFLLCLVIGGVISKYEKKKCWAEGHKPYGFYEKSVKRPLDFGLTLFALFFLWPFLLICYIAVRIGMGTPVIFKQPRPGLGEEIFTLRKYRTMTEEKDKDGILLPDEKRLTRFGKKMRSTSLDELPELVNIIKGDMSIVGPRPQLVRDMVFMSNEHRKRHDVKPGLTGLAQVNGRNGISWEEKLDMDLQYIDHISFLGDLKIVLQTVKKVLVRDSINEEGQATASDYGDWLLKNGKVSQEEYAKKQEEAERLLFEEVSA